MNKIFSQDSKKFIIYHTHFFKENKAPSFIFSHGLMSSMASSKAISLEKYCIEKRYNYIKYDNFGSGDSSGAFTEQTITTWLNGLEMVIDQVASGPVILIGSSKGAWLSLLAATTRPELVKGLICIATATDFTEELIWKNLNDKQKLDLTNNGVTNVSGTNPSCNYQYPITKQLIEDGRKYLMLNKAEIPIHCPVHFIHGMQDIDVPYEISMLTAKKIKSQQIAIKLVKDGDHKLSRSNDIQLIASSLEEILVSNEKL